MGETISVNADIAKINGFSGHADAEQLMRRAKGLSKPPKKTFIVHGEEPSQKALQAKLEEIGFVCSIPSLQDQIEI
jgi:metallo-beta-lactamase family protein